jgi:probable F420-dependent oxidoreductase
MRAGALAPHMGAYSSPEFIVQAARQAEEQGYHSIWVAERVLYPLNPRTPYGGTPDGSLPDFYKRVFEPIETLTWIAAHTKTIRVGTSVLNMPFHNPVMLAKRLTTLDVVSGGRLDVGFGQGWSQDEFEAVGAPPKGKAERADELVEVLKKMWGPDPVSHDGRFFKVAPSIVQPKPVQQPRPPIYMAAFTPGALARVARLADGWLPTGIPLSGIEGMMGQLRDMASQAGRDPAALKLQVLGHVYLTDNPLGDDRADFTGSLEQIKSDVERARAIGANELIMNPGSSPQAATADGFLRLQETLRGLI